MYHFLKPHRKLLQVNNASFCSIYLPLLGVFACLASFSLPCRNLSSISCKALSLFIQECLNSSLLFEQFWQYCILDRLFLSFSILKVVSTHCLLVSEISDAKSVLLGPCRTCFSPNAFKISVPFRNLMVSGSCYLTWNLSLLDVCGASFTYLGTFSPIMSSNILTLLALSLPRLPQCVCYSSCFTGHLGSI